MVGWLGTVEERMREALAGDTAAPGLYSALRYHVGWEDRTGAPLRTRAAKGLRPRLCLLTCHALGADPERAAPAAAAVELTHEFSLIHDDVEDGDILRRGKPSLWTEVGLAVAINAGDAMFALARAELMKTSHDAATVLEMARRYDAATLRLAEGQHLDLSMERANTATAAEYEAMAEGKTGALMGLAASLGALAAGRPETAAALDAFGRALGVAFQMADDILGLWGDPTITGKPAGVDLVRGKKGYPVVVALGDETVSTLIGEARSGQPHAVTAALDALERGGYRRQATDAAVAKAKDAVGHLEHIGLSAGGRTALTDLAGSAATRLR